MLLLLLIMIIIQLSRSLLEVFGNQSLFIVILTGGLSLLFSPKYLQLSILLHLSFTGRIFLPFQIHNVDF